VPADGGHDSQEAALRGLGGRGVAGVAGGEVDEAAHGDSEDGPSPVRGTAVCANTTAPAPCEGDTGRTAPLRRAAVCRPGRRQAVREPARDLPTVGGRGPAGPVPGGTSP